MVESDKSDKIRDIASRYYRRRDIQKIIAEFSKNREVVPRYLDSFGKRPDTIEYESDISSLAAKGATSFHCSEELWQNPLELSTELSEEELNSLRIGWDLIIDIDTKYLEYGKLAAELIIDALRFHNVSSIGLKFSGGSGWHLGIPSRAFPDTLGTIDIKKFFPQAAQAIVSYLREMIYEKLLERISELSNIESKFVKDYEGVKKVVPDLVLVSPRHLFRMPYSLHERTGLTSIVIKPEQLKEFRPSWARPEIASAKRFFIEDGEIGRNEARELLVQALDWQTRVKQTVQEDVKEKRFKKYKETVFKDLSPNMYPPCIAYILDGVKHDGRKRALFILLNFLKSLNLSSEEIEKKVSEWNKKNHKLLKDGYIKSQVLWFKRQKAILPPNCDKSIYKEIAACHPDNLCKLIKNPVNYTFRKARLQKMEENRNKNKRSRKIKNEL